VGGFYMKLEEYQIGQKVSIKKGYGYKQGELRSFHRAVDNNLIGVITDTEDYSNIYITLDDGRKIITSSISLELL
jgi:hypothetical protein